MHKRADVNYLAIRQQNHLLMLMMDRTKSNKYIDTIQRKTRQGDAPLLQVPQAKTNKLLKAPICRGSNLWNHQQIRIRQAQTRMEMKMLLKQLKPVLSQ